MNRQLRSFVFVVLFILRIMRHGLRSLTNIPEELQTEIFLRLPTRSLLVCKCVCKSFANLIEKPSFVQAHLTRISSISTTLDNSQSLILNFGEPSHYPSRRPYRHFKNFFFSMDKNTKAMLAYLQITPPVPIVENRVLLTVVGSCNGLICFCVWFHIDRVGEICLLLWNPAIRQCRYLPTPKFKASGDHFQFGYVSETNDYVIVKVGCLPQPSVEVYKMSIDAWTTINYTLFDTAEIHPLCHGGNTVLLNGSFHWNAINDNVVYYKIKDEKLGVMKAVNDERVLQELNAEEYRPLNVSKLAVINESLAMIYWNQKLDNRLEVWVMKDYGVEGSWTRQFEIVEYFHKYIYPVGYWTDLMMVTEELMGFQLYDLNNGRRIWELPKMEAFAMKLTGCFDFMETLVPVRFSAFHPSQIVLYVEEHLRPFRIESMSMQ